MNRKWLGVVMVALLLGILALLFRNQLLGDRYSWQVHFDPNRKDPYGLYVLHELLTDNRHVVTIKEPLFSGLPKDTSLTHTSYLAIGNRLYFDSLDCIRLFDYVRRGNQAFLSSHSFPYEFMDSLHQTVCQDSSYLGLSAMYDSTVVLTARAPEVEHSITFRNRKFNQGFDWTYFSDYTFCSQFDSAYSILGTIEMDRANFIRLPYGKGSIFLHSTPLAWTNLSMVEKSGLAYAQAAFSLINQDSVYWDAYSMTSQSLDRSFQPGRRQYSESPLQYILKKPPLAWAWYLLLVGALLFLLFRTKRQQRIIPVLEPNRNTSMEFLNTIGRLYFQQSDHKKLAQEDMRLLLLFIRNRYGMPTRELNEDFVNLLSKRSLVDMSIIRKIVLLNRNIETSSFVSENTLITFHQQIESFYRTCH